jgi:hypothetical protein
MEVALVGRGRSRSYGENTLPVAQNTCALRSSDEERISVRRNSG